MYKLCVFAGTTEGRRLVEYLSRQNCKVFACVATEYGETLLTPADNLTISAARLTEEQMQTLFRQESFDLVLDATHPYAQVVTENLQAACRDTGTAYLRVLRSASEAGDSAVYVQSIPEAVAYLNTTEGNILLTTGSKELSAYAGLRDYAERVYARVLPMDSSLAACREAGLKPARIIAMQGPFSEEMNIALLRAVNARYLVTKDGGTTGGFPEKARAAEAVGATLVVIGRPPQTKGLTLPETLAELNRRYGFSCRPQVTIAGIGPGETRSMTGRVRDAIREADCVIGASRMLEAVVHPNQPSFSAIAPEAIAACIQAHPEYSRIAVVMSGDTGFFSGTKKLLEKLDFADVEILPGLSSLSCLCAAIGQSYEDVKTVSLHGRTRNIARDVRHNPKVFALVGGENGAAELCRRLCSAGLGRVRVFVGERLSYPDQRIREGTAESLAQEKFHPLSAVLVLNDSPEAVVTHGMPDAAFLRKQGEEGTIPMTKEEVRSVCISKLRLRPDSVCWDIGAGTGSVSIEMAMQAGEGHVYAVERKETALELLEENKEKFCADNMTVIPGVAPEACVDLPAPTHVFVGGSSGNMAQILSAVLEKNPAARIVATAIALESVAELTACIKKFPFSETEVTAMTVAKSRKAGPYHLMMGANPVYIFTMQGGGAAK